MSVGKSIRHDSSLTHVTGESIFIDDRKFQSDEIFVLPVGSPIACGKLKKINIDDALKIPGVLGVFKAEDFNHNTWGTIEKEQPLLVRDQIGYMDEPICLVVAENEEIANTARELITIEADELKPIFDIDESISKKNFCYQAHPFKRGDVDNTFKNEKHTLEGNFFCGGQEHFYMESQAAIVYPLENKMLEVHSSSQHPTETQHLVAKALGLGYHQVSSIVKRMGGGFGGKESQAAPFAAYAGLAALKFNRPARVALTKDDDMKITGKRHPFKNYYKVSFNDKGKISGLKVDIFADAGAYIDLSPSILERAMFHVDGAYYFENVLINGSCCRTNTHSNTAFRGFGGPQGLMTIESIIEDIAIYLGIDSLEIRKINSYQVDSNNITPYGQKVENNMLPKLFSMVEPKTNYSNRLKEIIEFNKKDSGVLRGISCTAVKFGIAFTARFLNQGNALVNVHLDGTIQASTGATEMGQGVNTKIQQIISTAFGLNPDNIYIMPTSTERNHNTSPTAASSGSDINGSAALKACNMIKERLRVVAKRFFNKEPYNDVDEYEIDLKEDLSYIIFKDEMVIDTKSKKEVSFKELLTVAYLNRVSLGAYAHFKTENLGFDKVKGEGKAFNYFTNGVAVSEVSIDEYTGEQKVLRTDILMDLGRSINPGIDEGQVSGAFVQGMGWVTTEALKYSDKGNLQSHSPTTYKIPSIQDTPRIFNIELIENNNNEVNIHASKAVGEPPFLLGTSVWTAIKHAISFRKNKNEVFNLVSPATNEVILKNLVGDFNA